MGNCLEKLKRNQEEPDKISKHINASPSVAEETPVTPGVLSESLAENMTFANEEHIRSYDDDALTRMRWQLQHDAEAFLLNNILLSVQFFENYERETYYIKNEPVSERENVLNEAMMRENKHVFVADRLQECVYKHVYYQKSKEETEPLSTPRLFLIYDNVKASEPGDTFDYSDISDAPLYKLQIEDGKEPGYIKLRRLEVIENSLHNETISTNPYDSIYSGFEQEDNELNAVPRKTSRGEELLIKTKMKLPTLEPYGYKEFSTISEVNELSTQRCSETTKENALQEIYSKESNNNANVQDNNVMQKNKTFTIAVNDENMLPKKSILKNTRIFGEPVTNKCFDTESPKVSSYTNISDETETSGYISSSSRKRYSSETESNYSFSALTASATPKKVELSMKNYQAVTSAVLPEEGWTLGEATNDWLDEGDDEIDDDASNSAPVLSFYLNSVGFMNNFIDNFIINLGSRLGFASDQINSATTQGASIYCNYFKSDNKLCYEIFPALASSWPNAANQWIVRKRKIRRDPRTKFRYQWPRQDMVTKTINRKCFLIPIGFRPQKVINADETLQWKLTFPEAESYLESRLAHSHIRCYLFTLALHKTFMENEIAKIGINASHIKNLLFWQCEHNYAKWPEDRLGETLRLFLRKLYVHLARSRMPNYFIENWNVFKGIPNIPKVQKRLADILETPVMHLLGALGKLKYTKKDFYPTFNSQQLVDILVCKNPLRMLNPNIPHNVKVYSSTLDVADDDEDTPDITEDKVKAQDKDYQLKKRQRQLQERKKAQMQSETQKSSEKHDREVNRSIMLPKKMEPVRRRLVLEFFVPHFIAMARSSEHFEAIGQAIIYLDQAHRLCQLLLEESAIEATANDYLNIIRDKLTDCKKKLIQQDGRKFSSRRRANHLSSSVQDDRGISVFAKANVRVEDSRYSKKLNVTKRSK